MSDNQIIVTVSGVDKVGIVAKVTAVLAQYEVNIEDIKQTLMQGHFVMFLLGNIENSKYAFKEIKDALTQAGKELGMEIWVQRKESIKIKNQPFLINLKKLRFTKYAGAFKYTCNPDFLNKTLVKVAFLS